MPRQGQFTDDEIRAIRQDERTYEQIAAEYGVSITMIFKIIKRKAYKDVPD